MLASNIQRDISELFNNTKRVNHFVSKPVADDVTFSDDDDDDFLTPVLRPRLPISASFNQPGCSRDVDLSEIIPDVPVDALIMQSRRLF